MKTSKILLLTLLALTQIVACKKESTLPESSLIGTWYETIAMQPQGEIVREYTFYPDYKYNFKVTFKGMHSGTNPSQVTGEVVESGEFTIISDTLKFYKERLTSWETGFPSSDRTYNGKSLSEKLKYKISNEKLELEYRGPGPADEPSVSTTIYTRRN